MESDETGTKIVSTMGGTATELRLLGPMALIRDGSNLKLPASRKTRALLFYLAVKGLPVRRDRLCRLFWERPDDPKGALRWSLSKLRGLLGEAIVADRETAAIDLTMLEVDFHALRAAIAARPETLATDALEQICSTGSAFMEELSLPDCDEYNAWCIAISSKYVGVLFAAQMTTSHSSPCSPVRKMSPMANRVTRLRRVGNHAGV